MDPMLSACNKMCMLGGKKYQECEYVCLVSLSILIVILFVRGVGVFVGFFGGLFFRFVEQYSVL